MGRFYDQTAKVIRQVYDSRMSGPPVLDLEGFPNAEKFCGAWHAIRAEALSIAERVETVPRFHDLMQEQTEISANDQRDWRLFILKAYGVAFPQNMAICPVLAGIVAACPDVLSASISFMAPHKHIPPHRGPFRGVLRFYQVLTMPKAADGLPAAVLKVADREYRLDEGECMLWDDTFKHEVWNHSDEWRAVLLLDVRRQGMSIDMELFSRLLIGITQIGVRLRRPR